MRIFTDFYELRDLSASDDTIYIGVDEVGRGALAGPITACAIACRQSQISSYMSVAHEVCIRDSKTMSKLQRKKADEWLSQNSIAHTIFEISNTKIDKMGLQKANIDVLRGAVSGVLKTVDTLLQTTSERRSVRVFVDHFHIGPIGNIDPVSLTRADSRCFTVAAASIIAKNHRDEVMVDLSRRNPQYGWERNAGYGTKEHRDAIKTVGVSRFHRRGFLGTDIRDVRPA